MILSIGKNLFPVCMLIHEDSYSPIQGVKYGQSSTREDKHVKQFVTEIQRSDHCGSTTQHTLLPYSRFYSKSLYSVSLSLTISGKFYHYLLQPSAFVFLPAVFVTPCQLYQQAQLNEIKGLMSFYYTVLSNAGIALCWQACGYYVCLLYATELLHFQLSVI